jgi:tartronate-semialdehyde synthase
MDYGVQLAFENIHHTDHEDEIHGYGVDHVAVVEGLGCKAIRVSKPGDIAKALNDAQALMESRVPVVVEIILEKVTNIAMGTEIDNITEHEDLAEKISDAPTAIAFDEDYLKQTKE